MLEQDAYQTVLSLTAAIGPATGYLAQRLIESASREACQSCLDLLSYARWFTPARVERAALRLMDYGMHDMNSLRFLLDYDLDIHVGRIDSEFDGQLLLRFTDADQSHRT